MGDSETDLSNKFVNDGSFLSRFLLSKEASVNSCCGKKDFETSSETPTRERCDKVDGDVVYRHEPVTIPFGVVCGGHTALSDVESCSDAGSGRKKRKFSECPAEGGQKVHKRNMISGTDELCAKNGSSKSIEYLSPNHKLSAAEIQLEAVKHLDLDEDEAAAKLDEQNLDGCIGMVEGGTWEHRKRAKEMIRTADLSAAITHVSSGTKLQHKGAGIGGYLPQELVDTLTKKFCNAEKEGTSVDTQDILTDVTSGKSIPKSNKGYKMLQQSGWKDGEGLGVDGSGISTPIPAAEKAVLGQEQMSSVEGNSGDLFDQYRKRMMLAYRFRPNPLNNPRRSYDGYQTLYDSKAMNNVLDKVQEIQKKGNL